jgi:hypothetical protein
MTRRSQNGFFWLHLQIHLSRFAMNYLQTAIAFTVSLIYIGVGVSAVLFHFSPVPVLNILFCVVCVAYGIFRLLRGLAILKKQSSL